MVKRGREISVVLYIVEESFCRRVGLIDGYCLWDYHDANVN